LLILIGLLLVAITGIEEEEEEVAVTHWVTSQQLQYYNSSIIHTTVHTPHNHYRHDTTELGITMMMGMITIK